MVTLFLNGPSYHGGLSPSSLDTPLKCIDVHSIVLYGPSIQPSGSPTLFPTSPVV